METANNLLRAWMAERERSQVWLAEALGVSQPPVSEWLSGRSRPSPVNRIAIESLTGIPASSWLTEEEVSKLESLQKQA